MHRKERLEVSTLRSDSRSRVIDANESGSTYTCVDRSRFDIHQFGSTLIKIDMQQCARLTVSIDGYKSTSESTMIDLDRSI